MSRIITIPFFVFLFFLLSSTLIQPCELSFVTFHVLEDGKGIPLCRITIFRENDYFIREIFTNIDGYATTTVCQGKYSVDFSIDNKIIKSNTYVINNDTNEIKVKLPDIPKLKSIYKSYKDIIHILIGVIITYIYFIAKSLRVKKYFHYFFKKEVVALQTLFFEMIKEVSEIEDIDPDVANNLYDKLQTSVIDIVNSIKKIEENNLSLFAIYGYSLMILIDKNKIIFRKWKDNLTNKKNDEIDKYQFILNLQESFARKKVDSDELMKLIDDTKKIILENKRLFRYLSVLPV